MKNVNSKGAQRVDIKAIESAAASKIRGDNKLKGALASVVAQHMMGEAASDLYDMVHAVPVKNGKPDYAPIREALPTLGRAQKDAIAALYLVLNTAPKACVKAWDAYEKIRAEEAIAKGKKPRAVGVTLFGMRDALNASAAPKSSKLDGTSEAESEGKTAGRAANFAARFAKAWDKLPKEIQEMAELIELFDMRAEIE